MLSVTQKKKKKTKQNKNKKKKTKNRDQMMYHWQLVEVRTTFKFDHILHGLFAHNMREN